MVVPLIAQAFAESPWAAGQPAGRSGDNPPRVAGGDDSHDDQSYPTPSTSRHTLEQPRDARAYEVPDQGDPQADDEHVHAAPECAAAREDAASRADAEVREHTDDE